MARSKHIDPDAPILPPVKVPLGDPPPGCYDVFHHLTPGAAPKLYTTFIAPQIKGAFVHIIDDQNQEVWIGGNITIRPRKIK